MEDLLKTLYTIHEILIQTDNQEEMKALESKSNFLKMFPMPPFKMIKQYKSGKMETFDGFQLLYSFVSAMLTMPTEFAKMQRMSSIFFNFFSGLKQIKDATGNYPSFGPASSRISDAVLDTYVNVHGDLRESFLILMTSVCFHPFETEKQQQDTSYSYLGFKIIWSTPSIWYDTYSLVTMNKEWVKTTTTTTMGENEEEKPPAEFLHLSYLNGSRDDHYIFDVQKKSVSASDIDIAKIAEVYTQYQERMEEATKRKKTPKNLGVSSNKD